MLKVGKQGKILGQGTFGTVTKVDGDAVKSFKKLPSLINEVFVTRYVSGCPYFIKIKKYSLNSLTMTMDLWHTSLDQALKTGLTKEQRQMLHICILKGKAYLESRYIVHADLKLQNILVNSDYTKAVIADFGVSSASNSAKVECTPNIASPLEVKSHRSHDAFSLVVVTLQLMYGYCPRKRAETRAELRSIVREIVKNKEHSNIICALIKDDYTKCSRIADFLYELYGIRVNYKLEETNLIGTHDLELSGMVHKHVNILSKKYKFNKSIRCYHCCISILSRLEVDRRVRKIYIATMAYIFACTFEYTEEIDYKNRMKCDEVMEYAECTEKEIFKAINTIIKYREIIDFMFTP